MAIFLTEVRHQSTRPGGWFQLGLDVIRMIDPESLQMSHFRIAGGTVRS
ncbi:MAG: hypothetical protein WKF77_19130 [Planctomycetaceae bacterium]